MPKKTVKKDVEIIIQYENNADENKDKSLQNIMQKLFNHYIMKSVQNIKKGE